MHHDTLGEEGRVVGRRHDSIADNLREGRDVKDWSHMLSISNNDNSGGGSSSSSISRAHVGEHCRRRAHRPHPILENLMISKIAHLNYGKDCLLFEVQQDEVRTLQRGCLA